MFTETADSFYEIDRWYKARIDKPVIYPNLHLIDPDNHTLSLAEKLEQLSARDPILHEPVDIGMPYVAPKITKEQVRFRTKERVQLEQSSRHRTLEVDPLEVESENESSTWPLQLMRLGAHFGIFQDLFHPEAYFHPVVPLEIKFDLDQESVVPVFFGNTIQANETCSNPFVHYKPEDEGTLYTLLMTNPDGNSFQEGKEVLHWLISNIPGNDISKGDMLCEYMQALPLKGTGYHRIVFILFKQDSGKIEVEHFPTGKSRNLEERTFCTPEFYKKMEDEITPVGMAFFQTEWDVSVRDYIHQKLGLEMPIYEYDWPAPVVRQQEEFPAERVPFNLYMDKYRDSKNIEEELLKKRLKRVSPFGANCKREKYPDIFWYENKHSMSSWEHAEKRKENLGIGKYRAIYENRIK